MNEPLRHICTEKDIIRRTTATDAMHDMKCTRICVYECARESKKEGREFKNDGVAFENHSPGDMSFARVSYTRTGSIPHFFDIHKKCEARIVRAGGREF